MDAYYTRIFADDGGYSCFEDVAPKELVSRFSAGRFRDPDLPGIRQLQPGAAQIVAGADRRFVERIVHETAAGAPDEAGKIGGHEKQRCPARGTERIRHAARRPVGMVDAKIAATVENLTLAENRRPAARCAASAFAERAVADEIDGRLTLHVDRACAASAGGRAAHDDCSVPGSSRRP
jgi:hypothetical protein